MRVLSKVLSSANGKEEDPLKEIGSLLREINESKGLPDEQANLFTVIQKKDGGLMLKTYVENQLTKPMLDEVDARIDRTIGKLRGEAHDIIQIVDDRVNKAKRAGSIVFGITMALNVVIILVTLWNITLQRKRLRKGV